MNQFKSLKYESNKRIEPIYDGISEIFESQPFAEGSCRYAFLGKYISPNHNFLINKIQKKNDNDNIINSKKVKSRKEQ